MHVRGTDWAATHPNWYVEPERLAPKALQVIILTDRHATPGLSHLVILRLTVNAILTQIVFLSLSTSAPCGDTHPA